MRNELTLASVLMVMGLSTASAEISTDAAVKSLADQGFSNIEVDRDIDDGQLSVEGWRGDEKVEITYDAATGSVVKTETETVRGGREAEIADDLRDEADDLNDDRDDVNDQDDDDRVNDRDDDRDDANDRDDDRDDANDRDDDRDDANDNDRDDNDRDDNDSDDNDNDRDDD